jgi:FMN reductase
MAKIVAIAGSPSHPSRTYSLLDHATQYLGQQGIETTIISVRDLPAEDLVFGRYDSPNLNPVIGLINQASGLIVATPVYKASYTGVLKAFLDLLPQKALTGKVVLPIATGGTIAHLLAIDFALKPVLSELGARHFISSIYAVDKQIQRQEDGSIQLDEELNQRLHDSLRELATTISQSSTSPEFALAS